MKKNIRIYLAALISLALFSCVSAPDLQLHDPGGAEVEVLVSPFQEDYWDRSIGIFDFTYGANRNDRGIRLAELSEEYLVRKGYFAQIDRIGSVADGGLQQARAMARSRGLDLMLVGQILKYEQGTGRSEVKMQVEIIEVASGKTLWRILGRLGSQDLLRRAGPNAGKLSEELLPEMLAALSRIPQPVEHEQPLIDLNQEHSSDSEDEYYCDGDDESSEIEE